MEKLRDNVEIRVLKKPAMIEVVEKKPEGESNVVWQRINFENSQDFCKFVLEMARDMGINRIDFVAGCNKVAAEIEGWDNL